MGEGRVSAEISEPLLRIDKAAKTPGTPFALGLSSGSTNHVLIHTTLRIHTHRTSKNAATTEINWVRLQIQRPKPSHRQRKILYSISANSQNHLKSTQSKDEGAAKQRKFLLWWSHGKEGRAHDQGCEEYKGILKLQAVALSTEASLSLDVTKTSLSTRYLGVITYRYRSALHITLFLCWEWIQECNRSMHQK